MASSQLGSSKIEFCIFKYKLIRMKNIVMITEIIMVLIDILIVDKTSFTPIRKDSIFTF
jgi:hypothetical protein